MGLQRSCGAVSLPRDLQDFQKQVDPLFSFTFPPDGPPYYVCVFMNLTFLIQRGRDMQHQPAVSYITLLTR